MDTTPYVETGERDNKFNDIKFEMTRTVPGPCATNGRMGKSWIYRFFTATYRDLSVVVEGRGTGSALSCVRSVLGCEHVGIAVAEGQDVIRRCSSSSIMVC